MECPYCGKIIGSVIDSRPTKEGIAVRRRRECLACGRRFTTYEATADNLLRVLVKDDAVRGPTLTNLKTVLESMSGTFKALSRETEELMKRQDRLKKSKVAQKSAKKGKKRQRPKIKAKPKIRPKIKPKAKVRPRKTAVRKARPLSASAEVLKIIRRHKKGVGITKLKERTGFDDIKVRNIVSKAYKEGKIKRAGRGIYVAS